MPAVLGSIGCALAAGMALEDCAAPLVTVEPILGRLSVHSLPSGVTVIRDEHNASMSVVGPALDVLRQVRTGRRVVVMGDVFDTPLKRRERFAELGRLAAGSADIAVFVGEKTGIVARAAVEAGMKEGAVRDFNKMEKAAEWLRSELRPGDVVLIRARGEFHMERFYFALQGSVGCWMNRCSIFPPCDVCEHLRFQTELVRLEEIIPLNPAANEPLDS
ncbi:MAG: cyanophycin synthetase [Acidobacteriota bacterium]